MAKKLQLGYREIEERLYAFNSSSFWACDIGYQLLYAFGKSERDIERYQEGKGVLSNFNGILIKGLFCFKGTSTNNLSAELERLKKDTIVLKASPKIVAVSDGKTLLAFDMREHESYESPINRIYCDFTFFYPLMDVERVHYLDESPADMKAAEKLAKLHDELRGFNDFRSDDDLHDLNIFISRLLFCFFAEDTGIFEENLFTSSIQRYTKEDGSDLSDYLARTFNIMDVSLRSSETLSIIKQFPYVNGGLFSKRIQIPKMGAKARRIIIECGELDWKDINPDIFGSMIQAVVNPEERANQGMHYTSVPNIMKVINPLFLDELRGEYNKLNEFYEQKLQMKNIGTLSTKQFYDELKSVIRKGDALLKRMSKMKFFDPACGSGNFLIITYKCLRFLEMDILALQRKCTPEGEILFVDNSVISLSQFYGIELLDFPHEVAMLSLWLAEHQMNTKLNENFGVNTKALPLKNITQIVCGNACRIDWNMVCPHTLDEEVFIFGNPPYLGSRNQDKEQKEDMNIVFGNIQHGVLDYICNWFYKAALYCRENKNTSFAFVSTNSITQGVQIPILWEPIYALNLDILFAYTTFPWSNNAKYNAGVSCVIIGVGINNGKRQKVIYDANNIILVDKINPTITDKQTAIINSQSKSISGLKQMIKGSLPADDNNLTLYDGEKESIISEYPLANKFIKNFVGAQELINGERRYCIWINDADSEEAIKIPPFIERFERVKKMRLGSKKEVTRRIASIPYKFAEDRYRNDEALVIPVVSSERREYIPMGFVPEGTVVYYSAFAIYNATAIDFGIVTSRIHMLWTKTTSGKLESRIRYSAQLCYNTFPFPKISDEKKQEIESAAEEVLITREYYPEKTLAELYDPDKMPQDLREAHAKLDDIVESCYPGYPFASDEARLECLFKLYEKMTKK
jgi:type II restriction/modification system DNA methylase subunit YeeA